MGCLSAVRFNMKADILRVSTTTGEHVDSEGEWIMLQDEDSGEIIKTWNPQQDNPETPEINESVVVGTFNCMARGIVEGGIRVAGTTERFGEIYENVDYVRIWFPASVKLSKADRVTNIRDRDGNVIWKEEERHNSPPTVFNVLGVTPLPGPMGKHIESVAMLERAPNQ